MPGVDFSGDRGQRPRQCKEVFLDLELKGKMEDGEQEAIVGSRKAIYNFYCVSKLHGKLL